MAARLVAIHKTVQGVVPPFILVWLELNVSVRLDTMQAASIVLLAMLTVERAMERQQTVRPVKSDSF